MDKTTFYIVIAGIGAFLLDMVGGWDTALFVLVVFMTIDFITGVFVAGFFKQSPKSTCGSLESKAMFKGLIRKILILLMVIIAAQADRLLQTQIIRSAAIIGFCANELLSIIENVGLMGVKLPRVLINAVELLKTESGDNEND